MKTSQKCNHPLKLRSSVWACAALAIFSLVLCCTVAAIPAAAQTAGEGAIQGTVTDGTGAVVPGATVVVINDDTGVTTTQPTTGEGVYSIRPILPGTYTVKISATGFKTFVQDKVHVNALQVVGLNATLQPGQATQTVTVTSAPPELDTTSAVLGVTMPTSTYTELPVMLTTGGANGLQPRDITQVSNLMPGAQVAPGGRSSIVGGTAQRLGEPYIDGLATTDASQQGDNRPVYNIVPFEAIDQVQVVTSGFSAEYQGAGMENYSLASGGNQYHGALFEYNRNTAFDAWTFSGHPYYISSTNNNYVNKVVNGVLTPVAPPKTAERQNEYGFKVGGPITIPHFFSGHDKLFFFASYDGLHSYQGVNPGVNTVPTAKMRTGDFSELLAANGGPGYNIYDPSTLNCPTSSTCTRQQYNYNGNANVIPPGELSPITLAMMKGLPPPQTAAISNNILTGIPSGFDDWLYSFRFDYDISPKQRLSGAITGGNRHAIPFTGTGTPGITTLPFLNDSISVVAGHFAELEDSYTINPHLVNQVKYGFLNFGGPPVLNPTEGIAAYGPAAFGIGGMPAGQASENFPQSQFCNGSTSCSTTASGSNEPTGWGYKASSTTVNQTYEVVDNLAWVKGKHAMTFGIQYQWLEDQNDSFDGYSQAVTLSWNTNETGQINGTSYVGSTGDAFASYMIGALNSSGLTVQPFSVVGARYHTISPYFQDDYKLNSKLTLNLGLRWDYLPTYNETLDRWSFLNPNINNPITGNPGALQFAGNYGGAGVSCNCSSPISNYFKNFGPRLGFSYAVDSKTVVRGGFAILYSHAGGVGGAGGAGVGTGNSGFSNTVSFSQNSAGPQAGPVFWLNTNASSGFTGTAYTANNNMGGVGYPLIATVPIGAASQGALTGYFVCNSSTTQYSQCVTAGTGNFAGTGSTIAYPDWYLSSRAPYANFWNFGIERQLLQNLTISVNYAGSESHFLAGASNMRGLQSGELNPLWFPLAKNLTNPATAANITTAQTASGMTLPNYPWYQAAAATSAGSGKATITHMLSWMPQYGGSTDTWGNVANANYHALQFSLTKRESHGSSITVNYTFSKNMDDAGTARSGYALPATVILNGKAWAADRIDYSRSTNDQPQNLEVFGVYALPFGKGGYGADNAAVRWLAGGWKLSGISSYWAGLPLAIVDGSCGTYEQIGQGQCMPDANPNYSGLPVRQNGGWGKGVTQATLGSVSYISGGGLKSGGTVGSPGNPTDGTGMGLGVGNVACTSSTGPFCTPGGFMVGDLTRTAPYGLRGPGQFRLNMALRRDFPIHGDRTHFIFGVDCANVTNSVTFGNNAQNNTIDVKVTDSATAFGSVGSASADSRAFQFSGRLEF